MKTYEGNRQGYAVTVTVDGRKLDPRLDLWNHSPDGFNWGYGGSGPAQLALAILADHCQNDERALNLYQRFKWAVVAKLPHKRWKLSGDDIAVVLHELCEEEVAAGGGA
jgi:hypothetical protein